MQLRLRNVVGAGSLSFPPAWEVQSSPLSPPQEPQSTLSLGSPDFSSTCLGTDSLSTISSPVVPFSSCLQCFPASASFQMSQLFASGGQSIRVSASTSVFPMNIQAWFPLGCTSWISFQSTELSRVFSNTTVQSISSLGSGFFILQLCHLYMTTGKTTALTRQTIVGKVIYLLFTMLFRLGILFFFPRSKRLLISWLQSPSAVNS